MALVTQLVLVHAILAEELVTRLALRELIALDLRAA
jgi:hypothetical protein